MVSRDGGRRGCGRTLVAGEGDVGILEEMGTEEVGEGVVLLQDREDGRIRGA